VVDQVLMVSVDNQEQVHSLLTTKHQLKLVDLVVVELVKDQEDVVEQVILLQQVQHKVIQEEVHQVALVMLVVVAEVLVVLVYLQHQTHHSLMIQEELVEQDLLLGQVTVQ
tara:strand:- start:29 stop:361 length:333 start_codon:yes stop_codon:yes gene_type:complete